MAVMTACNAVIGSGCLNLFIFQPAVFKALVFESGLEKSAAAAAAIIIRFVGGHVYKIFFTNNGFDNKPKVVCNRVAVCLTDNLARILNRKLKF